MTNNYISRPSNLLLEFKAIKHSDPMAITVGKIVEFISQAAREILPFTS